MGLFFSIRDQEDNIWDIEAKYIIPKENSIKKFDNRTNYRTKN